MSVNLTMFLVLVLRVSQDFSGKSLSSISE